MKPWEKYAQEPADDGPWAKYAAPEKSGGVAQQFGNLAAGMVRGAGSIGATLLAPIDIASDALAGKGLSLESNRQRRVDMDAALQGMGADTDSLAYGAGKLGTEIAGTLGVGGALARGAAMLPGAGAAAPVVEAIRTAGMTAGGATGVGGMAARTAGGAITGGAAAALVNPEEAGAGALIGGALPGVIAGAGKAGGKVAGVFKSQQQQAGAQLAKALDLTTPQQIDATIAQLKAARTYVAGSSPTVAQALQTPQAGILQRVVSDSAGGGALRDTLAAQNAARMAALERVAPTNAMGTAAARQDLGEAVSRFATDADQAARARTSALYQAVPQDEAMLYLPDLAPVRDKYFGPAVFTDRAAVDKAVSTAQRIGNVDLPAVKAGRDVQGQTLAQAVRKAGGLSIKNHDGFRGELASMRGDYKNLIRSNGGQSPGRMAMAMHEAGYLPDADVNTLLNALRDDVYGGGAGSIYDDMGRQYGAQAAASMGDAPAAGAAPVKVTLKDFEDLRKSIGQEQRAAAQAGNDTTARALAEMKSALDDRINEVVRGDGAIDEVLPIDWANKLTEARKAKLDQVQRFRTGPQTAIFRKGADGQPLAQGGEVAAKFWGNRPGVADDVKSFRRLIGDNPKLLGQFRSMVTTEGASTQTAAGNLTSKFAKWVSNSLPGLREAFDPDEVKLLKRLAADVKRAEAAAAAGMSRGSNTYQNAQNALNLGLLDNPLLNAAANRIPVVNSISGPALSWARDTAREAKARQLSALLGSSDEAAQALLGLAATAQNPAAFLSGPAAQGLYRVAPILGADR